MSLRVVPFSGGLHPGLMSGPFVILRFPLNGDGRESEPATVYVDGFTGALYLDKPGEVERYAQAFGGIWNACLDRDRVPGPHPSRCGGTQEMSSTELSGALWRKSSYSNGQANCVEVTAVTGGRRFVAVRDSKAPDAPSLIFTARTWRRFTDSVGATREDCRFPLISSTFRADFPRGFQLEDSRCD